MIASADFRNNFFHGTVEFNTLEYGQISSLHELVCACLGPGQGVSWEFEPEGKRLPQGRPKTAKTKRMHWKQATAKQ